MKKNNDEVGDYLIEVKYFEVAIDAFAKQYKDEEAIRKIGTALLNIAVKTKKKIEKNAEGK